MLRFVIVLSIKEQGDASSSSIAARLVNEKRIDQPKLVSRLHNKICYSFILLRKSNEWRHVSSD